MSSKSVLSLPSRLQESKFAHRIVIEVGHDGGVNVKGFPVQLQQALAIMNGAVAAVATFFVQAALNGAGKAVNEDSQIIAPDGTNPH